MTTPTLTTQRPMATASLTKDLQTATADLHQVNPLAGLWRFNILGVMTLSLVILAWSSDREFVFWSVTPLIGIVYAFWLVCTHDAAHHTLTGWRWFDMLMPRLISYPMLWCYGLYAEIHRLHHGWNGVDLRDPERVQWTQDKYQRANPLMKWYVQHQWAIDIFVLGGTGLILKTFANALRFQARVPRIRLQLLVDGIGIVPAQSLILTLLVLQGEAVWRYLCFWFVIERVAGAMMQTRDHLEHYALWGKANGFQLTQLYACRNLKTHALVGWLMGGLNYHAVHHAFPSIPFNQLPEAFDRMQTVLLQHNLPAMSQGAGYWQEALYLSQHPALIGEPDPANVTGRHDMIPIAPTMPIASIEP